MYNEDVEKSKIIRWGSIFKTKTIEEISDLLGDDLLTMEEKERFLNSIRAVNGDEEIVEHIVTKEMRDGKERALKTA